MLSEAILTSIFFRLQKLRTKLDKYLPIPYRGDLNVLGAFQISKRRFPCHDVKPRESHCDDTTCTDHTEGRGFVHTMTITIPATLLKQGVSVEKSLL